MKHTFAKLMLLMLALALVLSGCNLIGIDPKMQADEEIAKIAKNYAAPVAAYGDKTITAGEAMGDFNDNYNQMYYFYAYYMGMEMGEEDVHNLMNDTLQEKVRAAIIEEHFDEAYALSDEEIAEAEKTGEENFNMLNDSALEQAEGKTDEEKRENARVLLAQVGRSFESMKADALREAKVTKMGEILRDEVTEVAEDELKAAFDERVAADEESYTADPAAYGDAVTNGTATYWAPDGYRTVKHILLIPEESVLTAYTDAESALKAKNSEIEALEDEMAQAQDDDVEGARPAEEIQADVDAAKAELPTLEAAKKDAAQACVANVQAKLDEVYAKLDAGEAFEDVMAAYGEDPGMQNEPAKTTGYYVCRESTNWHQPFTDGAMALNQVGDYSAEPVVSGSGVHIIEYASDVAGGAADFESVREKLGEEVLEEMKDANRDDTINAWIEAANATYDVEAFEKVLAAE